MGLVFTNEEFGALLAELIKAAGIEGDYMMEKVDGVYYDG